MRNVSSTVHRAGVPKMKFCRFKMIISRELELTQKVSGDKYNQGL